MKSRTDSSTEVLKADTLMNALHFVLKELNSEKAKKFNIQTDEVFQKMSEMVSMKRVGEPEEFGYLVAFLSSEYANYINED